MSSFRIGNEGRAFRTVGSLKWDFVSLQFSAQQNRLIWPFLWWWRVLPPLIYSRCVNQIPQEPLIYTSGDWKLSSEYWQGLCPPGCKALIPRYGSVQLVP
ncbi:uncharacterized protein An01g02770 [Aspergillus niger]|uniref:Contig An01c0080, genomic contig n=2 Tax=Aspergillus niger TaxID=5061 RepID=A2Q821_ASPNC|nr:uncharacterized protein An01g02770 [Aspergillus niger]CAK43644.1 unnamed protein product [Aspergillus niger]